MRGARGWWVAWATVVLATACESADIDRDAALAPDASDAAAADAVVPDTGSMACGPALERQSGRCAFETAECLERCDGDDCQDACLATDDELCSRCLTVNGLRCYVENGCAEVYARLSCCPSYLACLGGAQAEACIAERCADEWSELAGCARLLDVSACRALLAMCFREP